MKKTFSNQFDDEKLHRGTQDWLLVFACLQLSKSKKSNRIAAPILSNHGSHFGKQFPQRLLRWHGRWWGGKEKSELSQILIINSGGWQICRWEGLLWFEKIFPKVSFELCRKVPVAYFSTSGTMGRRKTLNYLDSDNYWK